MRPLTFAAAAAALWLAGPISARAHLGSTKYLRVSVGADAIEVRVAIEAVDVGMGLGLEGFEPRDVVPGRTADVCSWLARGLIVRAGNAPCASEVGTPELADRDGRPFVVARVTFECAPDGGSRVLRDDTVFDEDSQHEAIVRVEGREDAVVLRRGRREASLEETRGPLGLARAFLAEGALHFATGYDHVLFVLSLVLAAGLVARRSNLRRALADVFWLVTSFTIGHSVTLALAALEIVVLPSRPVEALIALSIVAVALHNVFRPTERAALPWLAGAFGLVHGLGFSSVLGEIGLPGAHRALALAAFNVGIELAQLAFVTPVVLAIAWASRFAGYERWVVRGGSAAIAVAGGVFLIQRLLGP